MFYEKSCIQVLSKGCRQVKITNTIAAVFPRGSKKRKCNNDDKHGHDQEKRRPSTLCAEGNITNESTPGILANYFSYHKINVWIMSLVFLSIRQFCHTLYTINILLLNTFNIRPISIIQLSWFTYVCCFVLCFSD